MSSSDLREAAHRARAEADRIAGGSLPADRALERVSGNLHRRMVAANDRALSRYTEAVGRAEQLEHRAALAEAREAEAARLRLTVDDVRGARFVRTRHGWHEVVRVSAKSVTVKTPYSWTDRIAVGKVLEVKR